METKRPTYFSHMSTLFNGDPNLLPPKYPLGGSTLARSEEAERLMQEREDEKSPKEQINILADTSLSAGNESRVLELDEGNKSSTSNILPSLQLQNECTSTESTSVENNEDSGNIHESPPPNVLVENPQSFNEDLENPDHSSSTVITKPFDANNFLKRKIELKREKKPILVLLYTDEQKKVCLYGLSVLCSSATTLIKENKIKFASITTTTTKIFDSFNYNELPILQNTIKQISDSNGIKTATHTESNPSYLQPGDYVWHQNTKREFRVFKAVINELIKQSSIYSLAELKDVNDGNLEYSKIKFVGAKKVDNEQNTSKYLMPSYYNSLYPTEQGKEKLREIFVNITEFEEKLLGVLFLKDYKAKIKVSKTMNDFCSHLKSIGKPNNDKTVRNLLNTLHKFCYDNRSVNTAKNRTVDELAEDYFEVLDRLYTDIQVKDGNAPLDQLCDSKQNDILNYIKVRDFAPLNQISSNRLAQAKSMRQNLIKDAQLDKMKSFHKLETELFMSISKMLDKNANTFTNFEERVSKKVDDQDTRLTAFHMDVKNLSNKCEDCNLKLNNNLNKITEHALKLNSLEEKSEWYYEDIKNIKNNQLKQSNFNSGIKEQLSILSNKNTDFEAKHMNISRCYEDLKDKYNHSQTQLSDLQSNYYNSQIQLLDLKSKFIIFESHVSDIKFKFDAQQKQLEEIRLLIHKRKKKHGKTRSKSKSKSK